MIGNHKDTNKYPINLLIINYLYNFFRPYNYFLSIFKQLLNKGATTLAEFINYLAEHGYIESSHETKTLLAYRLTGFCRPENDLHPISWCGQNGKSYELIYIVKHISERGDYRKMRQFFTGPEWVKDCDSSYALAANSEFRRALEKFYPKIFPFEKQASQQ